MLALIGSCELAIGPIGPSGPIGYCLLLVACYWLSAASVLAFAGPFAASPGVGNQGTKEALIVVDCWLLFHCLLLLSELVVVI